MQVLVVHSPTRRIRGHLRVFGMEVDRNTFAFDLTAKDIEELWDWLLEAGARRPDLRAVLILPSTGKPGFIRKGFRDKPDTSKEVDGVLLTSRKIRSRKTPIPL